MARQIIGLPTIEQEWETGEEFLARYDAESGHGEFFLPFERDSDIPKRALTGKLVLVLMRFLDRGLDFHLHARVVGRPTLRHGSGIVVEFLPEEQHRRKLVVAAASGAPVPYQQRRSERLPVALEIKVKPETGGRIDAVATDISEDGCRLQFGAPLKEEELQRFKLDSVIRIWIDCPKRKPLVLRGRVASVIPAGPQTGTGMEFIFKDEDQYADLVLEVARLREFGDRDG